MMMAGMGMGGMPGGASASPRMSKPNGVPNGGQNAMQNGMAAAAAAAGMAGLPPGMAAAMHMQPQQAAMLQGGTLREVSQHEDYAYTLDFQRK